MFLCPQSALYWSKLKYKQHTNAKCFPNLKYITAWKLSPILFVMPWMSWATSSCPEAMRAFSWPRRSRLSLSELSICPWPSYSFPCWACRALWPSNSLSKEAAVSSLSSSWPSCYKTRWSKSKNQPCTRGLKRQKKRKLKSTFRSFIASSWLVAVEMRALTVCSALRRKSCWRVA